MNAWKRDLQDIYDSGGKGAIFRSKMRWTEEGEKPTKYFFNIEKKNFNTKVIAELKPDSDGNIIFDEKEIMCEIHSFYADLYKSEVDGDKSDSSDFNSFIANLELPKLSVNERDEIEGKLLKNARIYWRPSN